MRLRRLVPALSLLVVAGREAAAQGAPVSVVSSAPVARNFLADWHMGRAKDLRHAGRLDAALVALDSVQAADHDARGVNTMRALIFAEKNDQARTLAALRRAHADGDTLAFAAAMQVATSQYRIAGLTRRMPDYALTLQTLQFADSIAPADERRSVPRLLIAATALALANGELATPGQPSTCPTIGTARGHMLTASTSLDGAAGAPADQVQRVRGALQVLTAYTELQSRQLRCA